MSDIDWAHLVSAITGFLIALTGAIKFWRHRQEKKEITDEDSKR